MKPIVIDKTELEKQLSTLTELDFPKQVIVEPVNICNLNCIMCPSSDLTRERGTMEMRLFTKIVDEITAVDPSTKLWPAIMGEPLLAGERLFEMLAYAQEKNIGVYLNTNAVLYDDASIAKMREYGVREIIVGMDAQTAETYGKIRRGGDFGRLCENVEKMIEAYRGGGPKVILQYVIMSENEHETEAFKAEWLEKGAIVKIRLKQGWGDLVGSEYLTIEQKERTHPCPWLNRHLLVLWDGEVCQCDGDMDNRHSCGNIYRQTLTEVWQGEMRRRRERHYRGDFDFEPCNYCNDWQVGLSQFFYPDEPEVARVVDERF